MNCSPGIDARDFQDLSLRRVLVYIGKKLVDPEMSLDIGFVGSVNNIPICAGAIIHEANPLHFEIGYIYQIRQDLVPESGNRIFPLIYNAVDCAAEILYKRRKVLVLVLQKITEELRSCLCSEPFSNKGLTGPTQTEQKRKFRHTSSPHA
jgi:hypothetical protein